MEPGRRGFRLPTETEWEVAARAGARTAYSYGGEVVFLGQFAWFMENSGKHVHPPRELRPSVRGVFDLHGNLLEWTHDGFEGFGSEAATDPLGPAGGLVPGGSWWRLGQRRGELPVGEPQHERPVEPHEQQRLPPSPEFRGNSGDGPDTPDGTDHPPF